MKKPEDLRELIEYIELELGRDHDVVLAEGDPVHELLENLKKDYEHIDRDVSHNEGV